MRGPDWATGWGDDTPERRRDLEEWVKREFRNATVVWFEHPEAKGELGEQVGEFGFDPRHGGGRAVTEIRRKSGRLYIGGTSGGRVPGHPHGVDEVAAALGRYGEANG